MKKAKVNVGKMVAKAASIASPHEKVRQLRAAKMVNGVPRAIAADLRDADPAPGVPVNGHGEPAAPAPVTQEDLPEAQGLLVPLKFLAAALEIAPKGESRPYLNGVYLHQLPDGQTRVVATEGHRLLVLNLAPGQAEIAWARQGGILLPTEDLRRIVRWFGKDGEVLVSYGVGHPSVKLTSHGDCGSFSIPALGDYATRYPDYQRIMLSSAEVLTSERVALESTNLNPDYLKSAGVIANKLEAKGIMPFIGGDAKATVLFTFPGVPEAVMYIMPMGQPDECVPAPVMRMIGSDAIKSTISRLQAAEKISRENAKRTKIAKFKEQSTVKADKLAERITKLKAALQPLIEAPKPAATAAPAEAATSEQA